METGLSDKKKMVFLPSCGFVSTTIETHQMNTNEMHEEKKLDGNYTIILWAVLNENSGSNIPQNSICTATQLLSQKQFKQDVQDMPVMAEEARSNSKATSSAGSTHPHIHRIGRPAKTYLHQLCSVTGCNLEDLPLAMDDREIDRERERERERGTFSQSVRFDDDDDDDDDEI